MLGADFWHSKMYRLNRDSAFENGFELRFKFRWVGMEFFVRWEFDRCAFALGDARCSLIRIF